MASDEDSLKALEALMNEFFDVRTTNEQKRVIEQILSNFQQQQGAWRHCLYYLSHTLNEYVMMYCLTTLEDLITKQWVGMVAQEKSEIRSALYKFLLSNQPREPPYFIRNKLGKLVVDIGRSDWPHFYPDFFNNILQLAQNRETTSLGLMLLQTASEELAFPKEDLSALRKEELHSLLLDQIPSMLSIVGDILDSTLEKHCHLVTATPPPSPTHGNQTSPVASSVAHYSTSPLNTNSILSGMFNNTGSNNSCLQPLPPLDGESHSLCMQALSCLCHFFSWMPLGPHLTQGLIATIFQFACFGAEPLHPQHHDVTNSSELGTLAMSCINELMGKNCVPAQFEDVMLLLFHNTFHLLQRLTKVSSNHSTSGSTRILSQLDPNYVEKFTDFLRLFVTSHLMRLEGNSKFPVLEFLSLLFKYTFQQASHSGFQQCLEIWCVFLDCLAGKIKCRQYTKTYVSERYKEALVSLITDVLRKVQFKYNQSELEELDDTADDESETEWQIYLNQCLEAIHKVSELIPVEGFQTVLVYFNENCTTYLEVEQFFQFGSKSQLIILSESKTHSLQNSLRDTCTTLQALGSLAHLFLGDKFCENFDCVLRLIQRLTHLASYSNKTRFYNFSSVPDGLKTRFTEVHVQVLATLRSFCHWLAQYQSEIMGKDQAKEDYANLVTNIVEAAVPNITAQLPTRVSVTACHLLLSVTATVRPHFLFNLRPVQELFSLITQGCLRTYPLQVQLLSYRSVSNIFLLPWPLVAECDQEWASRSVHHQQFIQALMAAFTQVISASSPLDHRKELQEQAKPVIHWTLKVLHDQVENLHDHPSRSKQLCFSNLQTSVSHVVSLLPVYLKQLDIGEDLLDFFLVLFEVLQLQVGVQFTEQTIQTFLNMFYRDQLAQCILHEGSAGGRVVEKFLHILQHVVQEPGNAFKVFVPSTIDFCLNAIYPVVVENNSSDVKQALFELLYQILLHNWRYFFKSSVVDTLGQPGNESVQNEEQFTKIMEAFCKSFLQPDLSTFRLNLNHLEDLNNKWKLYHKGLFRSQMLNSFLNVFVEALVQRSHDILREEIIQCIFHLASVNMDVFYQQFLTQYLHSCQGIDNNQKNILAQNFKVQSDQPTFTQNLYRLVNDLRYYRLCNSSLPPGSVNF